MIDVGDVLAAEQRVSEMARHTPLEYSHVFSKMTGAEVHLKLETFQRTGAFKIRGAANRIGTLSPTEREAGVVTASAGNHAQGVSLAASRNGVDATIVMPEHAPVSKVQATEYYGGDVVLDGAGYEEAESRAREIERAEGRTYVHAFDDPDVMAGQGTLGLEVAADLPEVDTVVVPIGGGGLIAGVATAITARTDARVIGVQAEGAASTVEALEAGERGTLDGVETIADGIAVRQVGERPFEVIRERVDEVTTVSDPEIAVALLYALEREKVLLEGAGAAALAAVFSDAFDYESGETIVPLLCGGNIDMNTLTTVLMRGLVETGRYCKIRTVLKDRPGSLLRLSELLAEHRANVYGVRHDRTSRDIAMDDAEIEVVLAEVSQLLDAEVSPDAVGVITPYAGQASKIRAKLATLDYDGLRNSILVDTVDSFQGSERDVIIISFVRSNPPGWAGFLEFPNEGPRRLNVALTRARKRCVLVGNFDTLRTRAPDKKPHQSAAGVYQRLYEYLDDLDAFSQPPSR